MSLSLFVKSLKIVCSNKSTKNILIRQTEAKHEAWHNLTSEKGAVVTQNRKQEILSYFTIILLDLNQRVDLQ